MGDRWCTADGWGVEVVQMTATPDRHDGESFRVSYRGFHVGYARSVLELERWIELADLQETLRNARRWRRGGKPAVARSCGGSYQTDLQPSMRHRIVRWPLPRACALRAGSHRHGIHDTITLPGPHGWPCWHCSG
jgi:hypothetical protein